MTTLAILAVCALAILALCISRAAETVAAPDADYRVQRRSESEDCYQGGTAMKRQYCAYCDDDMGEWTKFSDRHDTCGKPECEGFGRDQDRAERDEAHERLDRDIGYDRW